MFLKKLWQEVDGFVVSAELILIATILVIGMIVGLTTVRDQIVQELGDVAVHFAALNQSYSFSGITGHHASTSGTATADMADDCDHFGPVDDLPGFAPACIDLGVDAAAE